MSVALRYDNVIRPLIRILSADEFGSDGSGPWFEETYWQAGTDGVDVGLFFESCSRQALPGIGDAEITMQYGTIDGIDVVPIDLLGKHIRIQAADVPLNETVDPTWRTIWVGRCRWQDDTIDGASSIQRGTRTYRCIDLLASYTSEYPMDRHAHYALTGLAAGHPGYNYDKRYPNTAMGNRDSTGSGATGPDGTTILYFGIDDSALGKTRTTWTESQIVDNVLLLRRNEGDPIFTLDDPCTLLAEVKPVPVNDTDKAWAVLTRILDRRRGKGMAWLDWDDDSADPTGPLSVKLSVRPQLFDDITYVYAGTTYTISGGNTDASYSTTVNLEGDQRVEALMLRDTDDASVDELTTEGERIEVVVTASGDDFTLLPRWSDESETAFLAADIDVQAQAVYKPVLQRFGISRVADVAFKNGDGGGSQQIDWWTNGDGLIYYPSPSATAPDSIEIMDDMPLYEGYDYSGTTPVPADSAAKDGTPRRRKPMVSMRVASGRFVAGSEYLEGGAQVSVDPDAIWVEWPGEPWERNCRDILDGVDEDSTTITMGLRMPQRARCYSAIAGDVRRRQLIRIPDCHLWIGHAGAIWDLDGTDVTDEGAAPKRIGGTFYTVESGASTPGKLLRDDRAQIARVHAMAWAWYRSDSTRKSADWSVRCCGLLPSWTDLSGTAVTYPRLGHIVSTMQAGGQAHDIYTPVSRVHYDNRAGSTRWHTDWMEFDHGTA